MHLTKRLMMSKPIRALIATLGLSIGIAVPIIASTSSPAAAASWARCLSDTDFFYVHSAYPYVLSSNSISGWATCVPQGTYVPTSVDLGLPATCAIDDIQIQWYGYDATYGIYRWFWAAENYESFRVLYTYDNTVYASYWPFTSGQNYWRTVVDTSCEGWVATPGVWR